MARILIIEDNHEVRENIAEILDLSGHETDTAEHGKTGVMKAMKTKPDLILCDVMMPELDGFGVLKILNQNANTADIPFIFLTAKTEKEDLRRGMNLGADDYVMKPFDDLELLQAIDIRLKKAERIKKSFLHSPSGLNTFLNEAEAIASIENLSQNSEVRLFGSRDTIFEEGQHAHFVYYVESGQIKLCKHSDEGKELVVALLQQGEFFGHPEVIRDVPYSQTAIAVTDSKVRTIHRNEFFQLLYGDRDVASVFMKMLAGNTIEKFDHLVKIAYNSVRKRTADALLQVSRKSNDRLQDLEIKRDDLASIAGTAKETVIRTLSDFREEGIIKIEGRKISLLKAEVLKNMPN